MQISETKKESFKNVDNIISESSTMITDIFFYGYEPKGISDFVIISIDVIRIEYVCEFWVGLFMGLLVKEGTT